jgi:predicted nuclease of restriction endonuclease-like (RecB) superfamily
MSEIIPVGYVQLFDTLKTRIREAQVKAALAVNRELVLLYWNIGRSILQEQEQHGWGAKVVDRLAADLRREFPDMTGFSPRNLKYMRAMATAYPDEEFVQQLVAQIPWGHNVRILDYVQEPATRDFYIRQTIQNGWSRSVLMMQIESGLHKRLGAAPTNFDRTLPAPQSDLAQQLLKDPYNFDFLTLAQDARERDLERGLLDHLRDFLLELGQGFAFLGSQYHLQIGTSTPEEDDFYLDLLFYHVKLHCYVVTDLKMEEFKPEHAGKMNFYLSVVDDLLKGPQDAPSIGLILCKTKNNLQVEYALRGISAPLGISEFRVLEALPAELESSLPTVEQLEAELGDEKEGAE